jgi:hypothetical protein
MSIEQNPKTSLDLLSRVGRVLAVPLTLWAISGCETKGATNTPNTPKATEIQAVNPTETPVATYAAHSTLELTYGNLLTVTIPDTTMPEGTFPLNVYFSPNGPLADFAGYKCGLRPSDAPVGTRAEFYCGEIPIFSYKVLSQDGNGYPSKFQIQVNFPATKYGRPPIQTK